MANPAPTTPDIPCMNLTVAATGVYRFKVQGYSVTSAIATEEDHHYESDAFSVGGYDWAIRYYPYADVVVCLVLLGPEGDGEGEVAVSFACTLLGKSGEPSAEMEQVSSRVVNELRGGGNAVEVIRSSIECRDLDKFVVGDSFVLQSSVSVLKWPKTSGDE